jgi:hypothetical protein
MRISDGRSTALRVAAVALKDHDIAPDRAEKVVGRGHRRDYPAIELQGREGDKVVLSIRSASCLHLERLPKVSEAHTAAIEKVGHGTQHRLVSCERAENGHFAPTLALHRRRSRARAIHR